jgi:hypothetical protein
MAADGRQYPSNQERTDSDKDEFVGEFYKHLIMIN